MELILLYLLLKNLIINRLEILDAGKNIYCLISETFVIKLNMNLKPSKFTEEEGRLIQKLEKTEKFDLIV